MFFTITIIKSLENRDYAIKKLNIYSVTSDSWKVNTSYIYYIDIHSYKMNEENVFQLLNDNVYLINNITVSEIDESFITENNSEIIKKETFSRKHHVKLRVAPKKYYFEVIIKKTFIDQNYFVVMIEPANFQNNSEVVLTISSMVQNIEIKKKDISNGKIFSIDHIMDAKIERFIKYTFHNISLEKSNLIFFVADKYVSCFYKKTITSVVNRTRLFMLTKNSTQETDHVIYLSLLGPANKTKFSIMLDDHDVSFIYSSNRLLTYFYIERLNCTNDFYIFEMYSSSDDERSKKIYYLDIDSIYGDYEMIFYENIGSNISNIFTPYNNTYEIISERSIKRINSDTTMDVLKLTCKKPTFLKVKYLEENVKVKIKEGQEKILHFSKNNEDYMIHTGNTITTSDINREYKFYFGYYKLDKNAKNMTTSFGTDIKGYFTYNSINNQNPYAIIDIYHEKERSVKYFTVNVLYEELYYRIYLISNQYYKNIVGGITKLNSDEKIFAFKIRKDIIFDYFTLRAYSFNKSNKISLDYDIRIVPKIFIEKDKVMVGMNPVKSYRKKEIYLRYSNPYDKFNSKIEEDDFVYLLGSFITTEEFFPIYVDIRYYYNNSVITLEPSEPKVVSNNKEYKIFGGKNNNETEKVLININKCNCSKNYSIRTFYENENNLIIEENITEERTFLFHDNLFNNTKIFFNENKTGEINNDNEGEESKQNINYKKGDLYMNYFPINKELYNTIKINKDFSISYEDKYNSTLFTWNNYILNNNKEYPVNYSIYILPKTSQINTICQMSLIPPNISLINHNSYECYLNKGEYKISIIASVVNKDFPLTTHYDLLELEIPNKYNIKLIIIFSALGLILIISVIIFIIYCRKRKKTLNLDDIDVTRKSRLLSVAKAIGLEGEQDIEIFKNDEEDDFPNQNIINGNKRNTKSSKDLEEKAEENNFSQLSDI